MAAKFPSDTPREQLPLMLQTLLADRFKLRVHRESKILSAYALLVGRTGLKLQEVEVGRGQMRTGRGQLTGQKVPMSKLADLLSQLLDRPVVDQTEAKGVFDFKLEWNPDDNQPMGSEEGGERRGPTDSGSKPSIFTAVQEQLGLRLQAQKLPFGVLVIDHAEKVPTEN